MDRLTAAEILASVGQPAADPAELDYWAAMNLSMSRCISYGRDALAPVRESQGQS